MAETSSRQTRFVRGAALLAVAVVVVVVAAYLTWPGGASPRRTGRASLPTCDYASADWMQQPGCERPPTR
jgi:hypothetical protein